MPRNYQIIPQNSFPTEETYVNDNTVVTQSYSNVSTNLVSFLFVVASPKGKDGVMQVINGQQDFIDKIGIGPFSLYGQPLLQAYAVASTGNASVNILRVVDADARYASVTVSALYKVTDDGKMEVKFHANTAAINDLDLLEDAYTAASEPVDGWTEVKLFTVAALGRGKYGNTYQINLTSLKSADRENDFKNYQFEVYEAGKSIEQKESFHVCFSENAIVGATSYYADSVIMDPVSGSEYVKFVSFPEGFKELVDVYASVVDTWNKTDGNAAVTQFTIDDIDIFGGVDKYTKDKLPLYTVITDIGEDSDIINPFGVETYPDIKLGGGTDGKLDENYDFTNQTDSATGQPLTRESILTSLYEKAYNGDFDPMIASKNKFPTAIIADANYPASVKNLIHALNDKRGDSIALFDAGTDILTHKSVFDKCKELFGAMVSEYESVDAYAGKIRDPYNKKIITVTSTYALCLMYASQFRTMNGKHMPLADNEYGHLYDVFLENTVYPVFDEDIHATEMNELVDQRINFARLDASMSVKRATQTTRQQKLSMLSELNNCFILKDVKRAMEKMCAENRFQFADPSDINRFNKKAEDIANRFNGQVKSISASFGQNAWETEMSIVHLYVTIVNRNIVKTTIIEIDVNRG